MASPRQALAGLDIRMLAEVEAVWQGLEVGYNEVKAFSYRTKLLGNNSMIILNGRSFSTNADLAID
jgi:hypothetical protein